MLKPREKTVKIDETVKIGDCGECSITEVRTIRKSAILRNSDVYAYYRNIFDNCDIDKDGLVNIVELKEFLANQEGNEIPEDVIKCLHSSFDLDKDDQLDFGEFLDMINHPTVTQTFKRVGSRYLKFVTLSSVRKQSLKIRRTVTNTGLYEEEVVFKKYSVGMLLLSIVQIVCFHIDMASSTKPIEEAVQFSPRSRNEIWRYISYILVHNNCVHLYGNVLIQLLIGVPLELVHTWRVPVIYVAGAFGGCLVHSVVNRKAILVGGSGGLYAFYTAHIATVIMNWREMSHPIVHLLIFAILTVFDAIRNYYLVYKMMDEMAGVSYITHLGGAVVGLLLGINILRNLKVTKTEKIIRYISIIVLLILLTIFITLNAVVELIDNIKD